MTGRFNMSRYIIFTAVSKTDPIKWHKEGQFFKFAENISRRKSICLCAHEIVSITDDWIKDRCGMNSKEIMDKLKYLASEAGIAGSSYDKMNQIIEENLI